MTPDPNRCCCGHSRRAHAQHFPPDKSASEWRWCGLCPCPRYDRHDDGEAA